MKRFNIRENGIYRSRNGAILGVCRGLAESFDLSLFWVRFTVVVLLLFSGLWPIIGVYLVAALLMKPQPVHPIESEDEQEFYNSYVHSPRGAAHRLKKRFESLERRIQRMEETVTGREFDWERRFHSS